MVLLGIKKNSVKTLAAAVRGEREQGPAPYLKTRGLRLRCALVEVGHRLSVEVHPGIEIRTGGLLRSRTCCLACKHHTRVEKKRMETQAG